MKGDEWLKIDKEDTSMEISELIENEALTMSIRAAAIRIRSDTVDEEIEIKPTNVPVEKLATRA